MQMQKTIRALCLGALVVTTACADAPITAAQLQDDGQLREGRPQAQDGSVALFSAENQSQAHQAQNMALSSQLDSWIDDDTRTRERATARKVNLRLHGEGLSGPLPVAIVWSHEGGISREQTAVVQPHDGLDLAASQEFDADAAGHWRVEVFALRAGDRDLMLAREFQVQL